MAATDDAKFEFYDELPVRKKKRGFIQQLRDYFEQTQGGAIPAAVAKTLLGVSRQRIHELIEREKNFPGTGLRAYRFDCAPGTVLVNAEDVDRFAEERAKRPKGGALKVKEVA